MEGGQLTRQAQVHIEGLEDLGLQLQIVEALPVLLQGLDGVADRLRGLVRCRDGRPRCALRGYERAGNPSQLRRCQIPAQGQPSSPCMGGMSAAGCGSDQRSAPRPLAFWSWQSQFVKWGALDYMQVSGEWVACTVSRQ